MESVYSPVSLFYALGPAWPPIQWVPRVFP